MSSPLSTDHPEKADLPHPDEANPFPAVIDASEKAFGRSTHSVPLDTLELDALEALGDASDALPALWALLLSRYTRSRTVLFGVNRPGAGTLTVLTRISPDDAFADLVARVAASAAPSEQLPDTVVALSEAAGPSAPVVLSVVEGVVHLEHDLDRVGNAAAADLVTALRTVLRGAARRPAAPVHTIALLEPAVGRTLLAETNSLTLPTPRGETVVQAFLDQAARRPAATAVICGDECVSYGCLAEQVEELAVRLQRVGVGPATVVGVFLDRSPRLVVGLLAVLRAGGAFLPLDPVLPDRRIAFALRDSGARVLLTEGALAERGTGLLPPRRRTQKVLIDSPAPSDVADLGPVPAVDDLAYVTYTSGSTGVPKGVAIDHSSLTANMRSVAQSYDIDETDVVVQFSSVNFDAALEQMLLPLTTGAVLLQRGPDLWDPVELLDVLSAHGATVLELTPQYGYELALALESVDAPVPVSLRLLILGGEAVATAELARWRRLMPDLRLVVGYGPTEVTITSSGWTYDPAQPVGDIAPLGPPLVHLSARVIDQDLHLLPRGVPGEICLGGFGVARGYAGQPGLTASSFVPDPFAETPGARMYRSGDVGAWHPRGDLLFLGRVDEQVKIRGTRVEPGESAAALRRRSDVATAAVVVVRSTEGEQARLVGYVTPADPASPPDPDRMRGDLGAELAHAAIPSSIVVLAALPLTANGKLDRDALPLPQARPTATAAGRPASEVEQMLCDVWSVVLGVPSVGPDSDFFALGGNSLAMVQVSARVKQTGGYDLPLRQFFRNSTVSAMARALQSGGAVGD